jgi:hypothetical protein
LENGDGGDASTAPRLDSVCEEKEGVAAVLQRVSAWLGAVPGGGATVRVSGALLGEVKGRRGKEGNGGAMG